MPKRRRRIVGIIPRLGRGLLRCGQWIARHPQPVLLYGFLATALWMVAAYAQRSEAFRVTQVHLPPQPPLQLRTPLIGANVWDIDIHALAGDLKQQAPWLKDIRVIRQLPNAIRIDTIPRSPVAQVRIDRWYRVDREGFILPQGSADPDERLIRLAGFDRAGVALRAGKENADERLRLALRVLEKVRRMPSLTSRRLTEINVADPKEIRFLLAGETEVRCGSETELDAHLQRLRAALRAIAREPLEARYIDVRFKEPVVGPRT